MSADLSSIPAVRAARLFILALVAVFLVWAPGPARASGPVAKNDAKAGNIKATAAASCSSLKRKAGRYKRGSAKRRHYLRRYKKCRARARKRPATQRTPSTPAPTPTPPAAVPTGPVYLPSIFPNPNGYRSGAGCLPGYEKTYLLAGFSCQYAGYNSNLGLPNSPVWAPVYLLFGVWYCADKQFRFRC